MEEVIASIVHYVNSFLWLCSQPVYFIIYIFETNYEGISAALAASYSVLFYSAKICYLLVYGLASMIEYIIFFLFDSKDMFMTTVDCVVYLLKIVVKAPVYMVGELLYYGPWVVGNLFDGIVWLFISITSMTMHVLPTPTEVWEFLKSTGEFVNGVFGATITSLKTFVQTLFGTLTQFSNIMVKFISSVLTILNDTINENVDSILVSVESFRDSVQILVKYFKIAHENLYIEISILCGSFADIFMTLIDTVSYVVVIVAVVIFLIVFFFQLYVMYHNALNSANSLVNLFHRSLFGSRRDIQNVQPVPPRYAPERFPQEDNVSDAESDDSLLNNVRQRAPRLPQPRPIVAAQRVPQSSRVTAPPHRNEHLPSSSGEHSQRQPLAPSRPSADPADLVKRLEELDRQLCVVCQDKDKNTLIFPCKHLCVCQVCVEEILSHGSKKCPLCRGRISSYLEVFA